ncbi:MAG: PCMD domain-containing protein [Muribaculum sp.]|nr:PCMD domain-containing protein [Muribaculum sp.]
MNFKSTFIMKFPMRTMALALTAITALSAASLRIEPIKYGDFSNWVTRTITESKLIGGKKKTLYEIAPAATLSGNNAYRNRGGSPWATSNVYAKVSGIVKGSCCVTPATVNGNKMAKVTAKMEQVKVLGVINMDVMVAGTIFLGQIYEPITSTKGPFAKMEMGMPYTKRPVALVYDYKVEMPNVNTRVKSSGLGAKKTLQGRDNAEVYVLLQKRWEDEKGNIYAHRIGTGRERYNKSTSLIKGHQLKINYGDITKKPFYKSYMGLLDGAKAYYARNSKGKLVPVHEVGWGKGNETPTHVLVMCSSSCGEPFVGTEGLSLYVDNIGFGF